MQTVVLSLLLLSIPTLILTHLLVAPYTKVEESFHIQAIHDILTYGIPIKNDTSEYLKENYDHFSFPGAVPRTFTGAAILAGLSKPVIACLKLSTGNENGSILGIDGQVLARGILGLFNGFAILEFAGGVKRAFGGLAAVWCLGFQGSQFHVVYYASRTLSNMFAFGVSTLAMRFLLPEPIPAESYRKRCRLSLFLLTVSGIVFRSELALLLASYTLCLFLTKRISIVHDIIPAGVLGLLVGLTLTITIDSFFWQQFPLWPEFAAFRFNVISGQASAWGTHPWHFYFTNSIPRLLLNPFTYLVAIPVSLFHPSTRKSAVFLLIPCLVFVAVYSLQPHKEWRFIVYVVPPLTAAAAVGASYIWTHRTKSLLYRVLALAMVMSTMGSFFLSSFVLLPSSAANYPGAHALRLLHDQHFHNYNYTSQSQEQINVYLGNLACQTGVTRFLQIPSGYQHDGTIWKYDKTEDEVVKSSASFWERFDYVLVESGKEEEMVLSSVSSSGEGTETGTWEDVDIIQGFAGIRVLRPGDQAKGVLEERVIRAVFGATGVRTWETTRGFMRRVVARGWWVEGRMEPKIKIMRHVR